MEPCLIIAAIFAVNKGLRELFQTPNKGQVDELRCKHFIKSRSPIAQASPFGILFAATLKHAFYRPISPARSYSPAIYSFLSIY